MIYDGCMLTQQFSYTLNPTTAFFAELYAVKKAAEYLLQTPGHKRVTIFTDCRNVLRTLKDRWSTSELAHQTSKVLSDAGDKHHEVILRWIPAHKGHQGNEQADQAAGKAAAVLGPPMPDQPKLPWTQVQLAVRSCTAALWSDRWSARPDCRQTKLWFPDIDRRRSFEYLRLSRHRYSLMIQIITGHNFLRYHQGLVDGAEDEDDYLCRFCLEDDETSSHIIADCIAMEVARQNVFLTQDLGLPLTCSYKEMAAFISEADIKDLWDMQEQEESE